MNLENKYIYIDNPDDIPAIVRWVNKRHLGREVINVEAEVELIAYACSEPLYLVFSMNDENAIQYRVEYSEPEDHILGLDLEFRKEVKDARIKRNIVELFGKKYHSDVLHDMLRMTPEAMD